MTTNKQPPQETGTPVFEVEITETRTITLHRKIQILAINENTARKVGEQRAREAWDQVAEVTGVEIGPIIEDAA